MFQAVGLVWGYIIQQFSQTVYIVGAGFILAAIVSNFNGVVNEQKISCFTYFSLEKNNIVDL